MYFINNNSFTQHNVSSERRLFFFMICLRGLHFIRKLQAINTTTGHLSHVPAFRYLHIFSLLPVFPCVQIMLNYSISSHNTWYKAYYESTKKVKRTDCFFVCCCCACYTALIICKFARLFLTTLQNQKLQHFATTFSDKWFWSRKAK